MNDKWILALLSVVAAAGMLAIAWQQRARALPGLNDFLPLYAGATLLESGELYDAEALVRAEQRISDVYSPDHGYIRPPFHAAFLYPLTRLPYPQAYGVWSALSLAAIVGFVLLWRTPETPLRVFFASMSVPALSVLLNGQDVSFLLLWIALTERLHVSGRRWQAGLLFSLCAAKFHLFLLTPVLIVARRDWDFLKGLLGGGAVLAGLSFAVAGPRWPAELLASALNPSFSPGPSAMPNLHGALAGLPAAAALELVLSATVAAAVWMAARRTGFSYGFAASIAGGLLVSRHCYLLDSALLLPVAFTVLGLSQSKALKIAALLPLIPLWAFLVAFGNPYSALCAGVVLLITCGMATEGRRASHLSGELTGALTQSFETGRGRSHPA